MTSRDQRIIAAYEQGHTLKQVARQHELTAERVRQILRDHDVQRRSPGQRGDAAYQQWAATNGDRILAEMRRTGSIRQAITGLATTERHPKAWLRRLARERIAPSERLQHRRGPSYAESQLLEALRAKATNGHLSGKEYEELRSPDEPALATFVLRFGSWSEACRQAGLNPHIRSNPAKRSWTEMDMLAAVRAYAEHAAAEQQTPTVLGYDAWRKTQATRLPSFSTMRFQTGRNWLDLLKAVGQ